MNLKSCLLLALAFATILASAARADVVDNAVANQSAPNAASERMPEFDPHFLIAPTPVRPDDRAGIRGVPTTAPVIGTSGDGLEWSDAGVGAAAAVGAVLVALGVALTVRHSRQLLY